jgi:hypothetical protein
VGEDSYQQKGLCAIQPKLKPCEQLVELDSIDTSELQKAYASAAIAQDMLAKFATRNPDIAHKPLFVHARQQVTNIRVKSEDVFRLRVNEQQTQSSQQQQAPSPPRPVQSPQQHSSTYRPQTQSRQSPSSQTPLIRATAKRLTPKEYKKIINRNDYVFVNGYRKKNGTWVDSHYRHKPRK